MALAPDNADIFSTAQDAVSSGWRSLQGAFRVPDFSPEASLAAVAGMDPRFFPRVPMSAANIDVSVLNQLGNEGFTHGKEITAQTHPELYHVWALMSARAGLKQVPQLILTESAASNAITLSPREVMLTTGLLKQMDFRQVTAVLGHELGHGSSDHTRPRVLATALLAGGGAALGNSFAHHGGLLSYFKREAAPTGWGRKIVSAIFGAGDKHLSPLGSLLCILAAGGLGGIVANQIAVRSTELDADHKGAVISGDPEALISAFKKLDAAHSHKTAYQWFRFIKSGYPSYATRIARLEEFVATRPVLSPVMAGIAAESSVQPTPSATMADAPSNEIHAATQAERVSAPAQAPIAAL